MSERILCALETTGGHAHISQLAHLTDMSQDTVGNYLEMLKKDNKVVYHTSAWHLKIFNDRPTSKAVRITEKVLECLNQKRTVADLQCLLPNVKHVQLQETIDSLEKEGKVKRLICYKAVHPVAPKPTNPVQPKPHIPQHPQKQQQRKPIEPPTPQFACQDIRYMDKSSENQANNNNYNHKQNQWNNQSNQQKYDRNFSNNNYPNNNNLGPKNNNFAINQSNFGNNNNSHFENNNDFANNHSNFAKNSGNFAGNHINQPRQSVPPQRPVQRPAHPQNRAPFPPQNQGFGNQNPSASVRPHMQHPSTNDRSPFSTYQRPSLNSVMRMPLQDSKPPPPRPAMRPALPAKFNTGIDPYTNQAYGCSKSGYNESLDNCQPPQGHGPRQPTPRDGMRNSGIRQVVPMNDGPVVRQKYKDRTSSRGRGKSRNNSHKNDHHDPNMAVSYSVDGRTKAISLKDPNEAAVLAAMRKDSEAQRKILTKPSIENLHVELASDDSDDSGDGGAISSSIANALEAMGFGSVDESACTIADVNNSPQTSKETDTTSDNAPTANSPPNGHVPSSLLTVSPVSSSLPSMSPVPPSLLTVSSVSSSLPTVSPVPIPTQSVSPSVSLSSTSAVDVPVSAPAPVCTPVTAPSPVTATVPVTVPSPVTTPLHASAVALELQQISNELNSSSSSNVIESKSNDPVHPMFNFGLSNSDSDEEDNELAPLTDMMLAVHDKVSNPLSKYISQKYTPETGRQTHSKHGKIAHILAPVKKLCSDKNLAQPVLMVIHRQHDIISPWCAQITVFTTYSGNGQAITKKDAVMLAANNVKDAITSSKSCRQYLQQTDPLARMLYLMCGKRKFGMPIFNVVLSHKSMDSYVEITVTIHNDVLYRNKSTGSLPEVLLCTLEECCKLLFVPVPGLPAWNQTVIDYKQHLVYWYPSARFNATRIENEWSCDVVVNGATYNSMRQCSQKWLAEQSAACIAGLNLELSAFEWENHGLQFVHLGPNTSFRKTNS